MIVMLQIDEIDDVATRPNEMRQKITPGTYKALQTILIATIFLFIKSLTSP